LFLVGAVCGGYFLVSRAAPTKAPGRNAAAGRRHGTDYQDNPQAANWRPPY
jgi:hypothetical protein